MTAAKAGRVRAERIEGRCKSRKEVREQVKAGKLAEAGKWTLQKLWEEYEANKGDSKSINTDKGRFEKYIAPAFGNKEPQDIIRLDADRLRVSLSKKLKPQTVKHIFGLLKELFILARRGNYARHKRIYDEFPKDLVDKPENWPGLEAPIETNLQSLSWACRGKNMCPRLSFL